MKCHTLVRLLAALITFETAAHVVFASCLVHTGAAPEVSGTDDAKPRFDWADNATGDWFGLRNFLYDHGVEITGAYVTEPAGNPAGGIKNGFTYLHNIGVGANFDLDKLFCIPDTTFLITFSQRSGRGLTQDSIGNAISVQQIYGGGQTYRLVQMRFDQNLFEGKLTLSYGRLTTTSDFLTSALYCQFVTNGICGQPTAPFFNMQNGLTAYPAANWGAIANIAMTKESYLKVGVYDGDPNSGADTHGANFGFGHNGTLFLAEAGYKPKEGLFSMPARYSVGAYYHSGEFQDVGENTAGTDLFSTTLPAREREDQDGFYLICEQMLHRNPDRPDTGLTGFVTFVASPEEDKSTMPYYMNAGLIYEGLFPGRPNDKTALGMYAGWYGSTLRKAERAAGIPTQTDETDIELNHQIQLTPYFYLRPDIQYIIKPNGEVEIRNALVLGIEAGVTF